MSGLRRGAIMSRFLILLAVLQTACASPVAPCEKLEFLLEHEVTTMARRALSEAVELLQRVIEDAERIGPTEEDRVVLDRFATFIERAAHNVDSEELGDFLEELVDLLQLDNLKVSFEWGEVSSLVQKLVHQYGFDKFETHLEKELQIFMQRIEGHIEAYLRRRNGQLTELPLWFMDFLNENDLELKYLRLADALQKIGC